MSQDPTPVSGPETPKAEPITFSVHCPECDVKLRFHTLPTVGQLIACYECAETLEVVSIRPLRVTWAFDEAPE